MATVSVVSAAVDSVRDGPDGVAPAALVTTVVARPEGDVLAALDSASRARLLVEDEQGYRFVHDVIREVVEADVGTGRRMMLHRRVAEALEEAAGRELGEGGGPRSSCWPTTTAGAAPRIRRWPTWNGRGTTRGTRARTAPPRNTTARRWNASTRAAASARPRECARNWACF